MKKTFHWIPKHSLCILILAFLFVIPTTIWYFKTKINYDILVYLPEDIETIQGQDILTNDFGIGAFSFIITDASSMNRLQKLQNKIQKIDGVKMVLSISDFTDSTIPISMLPDEISKKVYQDGKTAMVVTFSDSTSSESTISAVEEMRKIVKDEDNISGMTAMVLDTMNLSNEELLAYIGLAVILCYIVLALATDSYFIPLFLLGNIGLAILYNMGTNIFLGEISYITKAITAVLQLGVTTDFSIFLYHKYEHNKENCKDKKEAMSIAIEETFQSVIGSSFTTIAGFLSLCAMDLTLGKDIGIVMAKGVIWGLICVLTVFPAFLILFDTIITKTKHRNFLPSFEKLQNIIVKKHKYILPIFILICIPAIYGNQNYKVYYKLDKSLPSDLPSQVANRELSQNFHIVSPQIILVDKNMKNDDLVHLVSSIQKLKGIDLVLSSSSFSKLGIEKDIFPKEIHHILENDKYKLILVNSTYEVASDALNKQIDEINKLVNHYDKHAVIVGEGALTKDLVEIADHDFKMVNYISIFIIFIIMLFVFSSIGLPIILVITIEAAIFANMAISYFSNTTLPFIASIIIGTIQLGATIDYAILMSTKYLECRKKYDKEKAMRETLAKTISSIIVSALCFFAATFGVAIYSKIDMIASICHLLSRGAIISMIVVIFVLPAMLLTFDKFILKTTKGMKEGILMKKKKLGLLFMGLCLLPNSVFAFDKKETVYTNLNMDGSIKQVHVTNHLSHLGNERIDDETKLKEILNINGKETFMLQDGILTWNAKGKDIFYKGVSEKELPIHTHISYFLNDEEMDGKDMVGKKGKVKIIYSFENTEKHKTYINHKEKILYTPFVVTLGTILENNKNENISITNGKVVNTGTKSMLISIASPGLYESTSLATFQNMNQIIIEYETESFKLGNVYFTFTPKLFEEKDLSIFTKMDSLYPKMDILQNSMDEINEGVTKLVNGSSQLLTGADTIYQNLRKAEEATKQLQAGSLSLNDGLKKVILSLQNIQNTFANQGITGSLQNLTALKNENDKAILSILTKSGQTFDNLASLYIHNNLKDYTGTDTTMLSIKYSYEMVYLLKQNNAAIDGTISSMTSLSNQITRLLSTLQDSFYQLESGANILSNGLTQLQTGIHFLYEGSNSLVKGTQELHNGAEALLIGTNTFNKDGIGELTHISQQAKEYSIVAKKLKQLSMEYSGFSSNNSQNTLFVSMVETVK